MSKQLVFSSTSQFVRSSPTSEISVRVLKCEDAKCVIIRDSN
jgi:hypothetical protein